MEDENDNGIDEKYNHTLIQKRNLNNLWLFICVLIFIVKKKKKKVKEKSYFYEFVFLGFVNCN